MNAWAVSFIRYGTGVLDWTKEESKTIDIKTRKLMTINRSLYPRRNVGRLHLARKGQEGGLISCEECVNMKVQSLDKCLSERKEWMLKFVVREKRLSEVEDQEAFKKNLKQEKRSQWLEKQVHGIFLIDTEKVKTEGTWRGNGCREDIL